MKSKRGSQRDHFKFQILNRKGQFFILAAVILAVIIIGLGVVYNVVNVPESSKKFYSYSSQLNQETGAVVDYSLYSGNSQVANFVNDSVAAVLNSYPELDIFTCYTTSSNELTCDNYGNYDIILYLPSQLPVSIGPGTTTVETGISGGASTSSVHHSPKSSKVNINSYQNLTVESGGINYSIDLTKAQASSNQYYFVFRANTTAGNLLSAQEGG
ncbi:Uncharacterised protein [uncultured archaeon]|nr:Uncharacterised protein [uncultured archaeon]